MIEKYTLITNLQYVSIGEVRTFCYALLVEENEGLSRGSTMFKVRGFGTDPAWPVFDIFLKNSEYRLADACSPHVFIGCDGEMRPMALGYIMQFKDGPALELVVANPKAHLHEDRFEGPSGESPILRVWAVLPPRVRQFMQQGTYMPSLTWGPV